MSEPRALCRWCARSAARQWCARAVARRWCARAVARRWCGGPPVCTPLEWWDIRGKPGYPTISRGACAGSRAAMVRAGGRAPKVCAASREPKVCPAQPQIWSSIRENVEWTTNSAGAGRGARRAGGEEGGGRGGRGGAAETTRGHQPRGVVVVAGGRAPGVAPLYWCATMNISTLSRLDDSGFTPFTSTKSDRVRVRSAG